ncbi:MAG: NAD(P)H-binding protein [Mycobacterium sp.]|nr:NAD(P)H-binding protein [Mycobacterium sp.]
MKLTIVGSTGLTGRHVLTQAPQRGHDVVAFTRRPDRLPRTVAPARVVAGDGRDPAAIETAVHGADAVIAIVSARSRKGPHHTAEVARVITSAMSASGVDRLITTSVYPLIGQSPRLPMALLRRVFADAYDDMRAMEQHVRSSSLDWTIIRLNRLTNADRITPLRLSTDLLVKPAAMSRPSVAAALLDIAEAGTYLRTAVNASGR